MYRSAILSCLNSCLLPSARFFFILLAATALAAGSPAKGYYDFNEGCSRAYQHIISLQLGKGREALALERSARPGNLIPVLLENYIDFLAVFVGEDRRDFLLLEKNRQARLSLLQEGDTRSPYYLYALAEVNLQWAFARMKFGEYFTAFWEIKRAYVLLEENRRKYPSFTLNGKSLGVLHALAGTIPDNFRWGAAMLGVRGTIEEGIQELREAMLYSGTHGRIFYDEAAILHAFLLLYLQGDEQGAWQPVQAGTINPEKGLLHCFSAAVIAMRTRHNDAAIEILANRPAAPAYLPFHYLDYLLGITKLQRLDRDADVYLKRFVSNYAGTNYIKDAWQKLAWHSLVAGDTAGYRRHMQSCKTSGSTLTDPDRQAMREAGSGVMPEVTLLKARLLGDGGYYKRAIALLSERNGSDFKTDRSRVEYIYRLGRLYHDSGQRDKAVQYYLEAIARGERLPHYYAASAALHLGILYEKEGNFTKAEHYYRKCYSLKNHEYQNSLEQKAKAGLNRIGK